MIPLTKDHPRSHTRRMILTLAGGCLIFAALLLFSPVFQIMLLRFMMWACLIFFSMSPMLLAAAIALLALPLVGEVTQMVLMIVFRLTIVRGRVRLMVAAITMLILMPLCLFFQHLALASGLPEVGIALLSDGRSHAEEIYSSFLLISANLLFMTLSAGVHEVTTV